MGFFKDFKDDFSQAVNELMPGEDNLESTDKDDDMVVNTLEDEVDVASELSKFSSNTCPWLIFRTALYTMSYPMTR